MGEPARIDRALREKVLSTLLSDNPGADVVAITTNGSFVPMPDDVPLSSHPVIQGADSALDLVVPADRKIVIAAWIEVLATGAHHVRVHLLRAPDLVTRMHFIDVTEAYGVFIGVMITTDERGGRPGEVEPRLAPRVATMKRSLLGFIEEIDEWMPGLLGWPPEELIGLKLLDITHPDDRDRCLSAWMDMIGIPGAMRRARLRLRHWDGSWIWFEVTHQNLLEDPEARHVATELLDISDEMAAQEALRANERLLRRLTEALPVGVMQIDVHGRIIHSNERVAEILGTPAAEHLDAQFRSVAAADQVVLRSALAEVLSDGVDVDREVALSRAGEPRRCTVGLRALTAESGTITGAIVCITDVTETVRVRQELENRAMMDALTGCRNRASIMTALEESLAQCPPSDGVALLFIDLDGFKQINDGFGHAAGDHLLQYVARCLTSVMRPRDFVGRFGGDEFLVVCRDIPDPTIAMRIAGKVCTAIQTEVNLGPVRTTPRASVGVAWTGGAAVSADELIARADRAMYRSKKDCPGIPVLAGARDSVGVLTAPVRAGSGPPVYQPFEVHPG